jgi:hypothetical protein
MNNSISYITVTVAWLGFFSAIVISFYFYLHFRNSERMALINKGVDITEIFKTKEFTFKFPWLRLGILILGVGAGLLIAVILTNYLPMPKGDYPSSVYLRNIILMSSTLIFGGLGLILGNVFERLGKKKNG